MMMMLTRVPDKFEIKIIVYRVVTARRLWWLITLIIYRELKIFTVSIDQGSPNIFIRGPHKISNALSGPKVFKHIQFFIVRQEYILINIL